MPIKAIEIEGLKELQAGIKAALGGPLPKEFGAAHRTIGELVISRLSPRPDPAAVGSGAGSDIRASASKRDVILRVGGSHRARHSPQMQWGRRLGRRVGTPAPPRPFIRGTIDRHQVEIGAAYLKAISAAMSSAFAETTP